MPYCCVPMCKRSKVLNPQLSFFKFPGDDTLRKKWLSLIRRDKWQPTPNSTVCSWHFPQGRESGPTRFHWNESKLFSFQDVGARKKKGKKLLQDNVECMSLEVESSSQLTETEQLKKDLEEAQLLNAQLSNQVQQLKLQTRFQTISNNDEVVNMYTGLPNAQVFMVLVESLKRFELQYFRSWTVQKLSLDDQVFLTLMKLRINTPYLDIAVRFGISTATASNIFTTLVCALHEILFVGCMDKLPSATKVASSLPACFTAFSNCRQVWDCTEVSIEVPRSDLEAQRMTYSHYKSLNTFKALVSIVPNGTIQYCSKLYTGNTSDKEIVIRSGILETCEPGDMIMADKGFLIRDILPEGVTLNMPSFLSAPSRQFTADQVLASRSTSRARIHVERSIQRIKEFSILKCIPSCHRQISTVLFQLCCALVNLQNPIIS